MVSHHWLAYKMWKQFSWCIFVTLETYLKDREVVSEREIEVFENH